MADFLSTLISSPYYPGKLRGRSTKSKAYFALAVVCFLWGTTWLASKEGVRYMPAFQLAGMRQLLGGLAYVGYFVFTGKARWPNWKQWQTILLLALLNFFLSNGLATWGLKYISAGLAAIINAIVPLWLVVYSLVGKGPRLTPRAIIGFAIGFSGICFVFYEHLSDFLNPTFVLGIIISLIATFTWAMGSLFTKRKASSFNPYFSIGLQMVISGCCLLAMSKLTGNNLTLGHIPYQGWLAMAYLVIFGSVLSFIAYLYSLQHLPAEQASLYAYINPMVAVLLGYMLFHESLTWFVVTGGAITLVGVYLVSTAFRKMK